MCVCVYFFLISSLCCENVIVVREFDKLFIFVCLLFVTRLCFGGMAPASASVYLIRLWLIISVECSRKVYKIIGTPFPFPIGGPLTVRRESLSHPTKAMLARPRPFHLRFWVQPDLGTDRSCLFILLGRGVGLFACLTPSNNSFIFPVHNNLLKKTLIFANSAIRSDTVRSQSGRPSNSTSFVVRKMQIHHCFLCTNASRRLRIMIISIWWLFELIRSLLHTLCVIAIRHELDSTHGSLFEERVVMYRAVFDFFRNEVRFWNVELFVLSVP